MTDGRDEKYEEHGPYEDAEPWPQQQDWRSQLPVPPPRPVSRASCQAGGDSWGGWPTSAGDQEEHEWGRADMAPDASAATASAEAGPVAAAATASACVRTPVFSKASICIAPL